MAVLVVLGNGSSDSYYGDEDNPYDGSNNSGSDSDSDFNSSFNKTNTFTRFEDKYLTPGASCRRSV